LTKQFDKFFVAKFHTKIFILIFKISSLTNRYNALCAKDRTPACLEEACAPAGRKARVKALELNLLVEEAIPP
jgi:hypothetical protein